MKNFYWGVQISCTWKTLKRQISLTFTIFIYKLSVKLIKKTNRFSISAFHNARDFCWVVLLLIGEMQTGYIKWQKCWGKKEELPFLLINSDAVWSVCLFPSKHVRPLDPSPPWGQPCVTAKWPSSKSQLPLTQGLAQPSTVSGQSRLLQTMPPLLGFQWASEGFFFSLILIIYMYV